MLARRECALCVVSLDNAKKGSVTAETSVKKCWYGFPSRCVFRVGWMEGATTGRSLQMGGANNEQISVV